MSYHTAEMPILPGIMAHSLDQTGAQSVKRPRLQRSALAGGGVTIRPEHQHQDEAWGADDAGRRTVAESYSLLLTRSGGAGSSRAHSVESGVADAHLIVYPLSLRFGWSPSSATAPIDSWTIDDV